jgi:hypothetical protein
MYEQAMTSALKKMNLVVKVDSRVLGQIVDDRIEYNLR